jgi:hypothetical protein
VIAPHAQRGEDHAVRVATRKNDDGAISLFTIDPTRDGFEFVIGMKAGKRVLTIRDGQHEHEYVEE